MRTRLPTSSVLAGLVGLISLLLTLSLGVLVALLELDSSYEPADSLLSSVPDIFMVLAFVLVGGIVTIKRPGNLVGWALSLAGVGLLLGGVLETYAELALLAKPEAGLPAGAAAGAIAGGSWTALMAGVFLLLLLFPEGHAPSPRWPVVARLVLIAFAAVWVIISTAPGQLEPPVEAFENPLAFTSNDGYVTLVFPIIAICLVCVGLAAISLLLRFRRSRGDERQQFKWLAASAGLLLVLMPIQYVFEFSGVAGAVFAVVLFALPVSVGIAILRYRLYEIDRIVNRAVVYGALSALLAGIYFGIVLAMQKVFSSFTGGSDLAIAVSTLAVAALFRPVRRRIQEIVDRRFYRAKYDAQETLEAFNARLRDEIDLDSLSGEIRAVVQETMQPAHVSLWLRGPEGER
jgi:hypothetical protein